MLKFLDLNDLLKKRSELVAKMKMFILLFWHLTEPGDLLYQLRNSLIKEYIFVQFNLTKLDRLNTSSSEYQQCETELNFYPFSFLLSS